uniref:Centromere protein P n=1 Tax=Cyprinus carpio TaxID=7962 RepID=A0A8C1YC45_CYPCA
MEQNYEEEIQMLQQEIKMLESEKEETLRSIFMKHGLQRSVCKERGGAQKHTLRADHRSQRAEKKPQTENNGIALNECFVKTVHRSNIKMQISFDYLTRLFMILSNSQCFITGGNLVVDSVEFKDFSAFVSMEDTKDLLLFFRTLKTFSERSEERRQTFQPFQEKYQDVVSLPEGCRSELMIIRSPQLSGISMTIFWKIDVSMEGVVNTSLELLLKMPDQGKINCFDTKKVMENGSDNFQSLLRVLGVEASIDNLIKTMCL